MTTNEEVKAIRKAIKAQAPTVSVRKSTGTASAWIDIQGSLEFGNFTDEEEQAMNGLGLPPHKCNLVNISPDDRAYWLKKLTS